MGTGQFAKKHINLWKKFSNVKVIGFYSHNNSDILNLKKYSNIEELIKDSDIVDLVTQNHFYHEVIKKILKQRKNFVVEKPFCINFKEIEYLENALKNYEENCFSIFQYRFNSIFNKFLEDKENFKESDIISIAIKGYYFRDQNYYNNNNWKKISKKSGGGVLIMQGIHITDILFQKFGFDFKILKVKKTDMISEDIEQTIFVRLKYQKFPVFLNFTTKVKKEFENIEIRTNKFFFDVNKYGIFKSKFKIINKINIFYSKIFIRFFYKKGTNDLYLQFNDIIDSYLNKKNTNKSRIQKSINTMKSIIRIYNF